MFYNKVKDFFNYKQDITLGDYTISTKLALNLLVAFVAVAVLFAINAFSILNTVLLFVALFLGLTLLEQLFFYRKEQVLSNGDMANLVDNQVVQEMKGDVNGATATPCYNAAYKVVSTQYGDKALQAGFNENVEAYQQGGINFAAPDMSIYQQCMRGKSGGIDASEENFNEPLPDGDVSG